MSPVGRSPQWIPQQWILQQWICLLAACLLAASGPGCSKPGGPAGEPAGETAESSPASPTARRVETDRGPVRLVVEVDPGEPRLSDEPELTVTLDVDSKLDVELPPFLESVPGFLIRSFREDPPRLKGNRRISRQVYRIEPEDTGEYEIPAVVVRFQDDREGADQAEHEVSTDPLKIKVTSLFDDAAPTLAALRPPSEPSELPVTRTSRWPLYGAVVGAIVLALVLLWIFTHRRLAVAVAPALSPSELAQREFERLMQDDPLARGETNTFFVEMTAIVRRYIERSTGVRAPEQTTEEFLRAMRTHESFPAETRDRLRDFLQSADLVKFAAQVPIPDEIEESFRLAQEFTGLPGTLSIQGRAA